MNCQTVRCRRGHGLEIIIRGDRVLYLGSFGCNSPWSDYDPDDEWNFVNGIRQDEL